VLVRCRFYECVLAYIAKLDEVRDHHAAANDPDCVRQMADVQEPGPISNMPLVANLGDLDQTQPLLPWTVDIKPNRFVAANLQQSSKPNLHAIPPKSCDAQAGPLQFRVICAF
jgi:hypothetical protein